MAQSPVPPHGFIDSQRPLKNATPVCVFECDGVRCTSYAVARFNVCFEHGARRAEGVDPRSTYQFTNESIRRTYERFEQNPDRLSLAGELALQRTCIQAIADKVNESGKSLKDLSPEMLMAIQSTSKQAAEVAESMARIERGLNATMSIEHVAFLVDRLASICARYLTAEQLRECAALLASIDMSGPRMPGKVLLGEGTQVA